jgi:hypothetical protein
VTSVAFETDFGVGASNYYYPFSAANPPDEAGSPPPMPQPQGWMPAMSLDLAPDGSEYLLSFTEPPAWSRDPWHIPATASGFYVPAVLDPSNLAWIGEGPSRWGYSIDGSFRNANISPGPPGSRNVIPFDAAAPIGTSASPPDWTQPHTFTLHLLYRDVPPYVWWLWNGQSAIAPQDTSIMNYYFFPQDDFRAKKFYDGYPSAEPVQPVLPPGLTSLDYGGLGPTEVPGIHLVAGDRFSTVFDFKVQREPGVALEVTSDPAMLVAPQGSAPLVPSSTTGGTVITTSPPTTTVSSPTRSLAGVATTTLGSNTWPGWDRDILTALRAPINTATLLFLDTWHSYEQSSCTNNPLNTTQVEPTSTRCNSAGVQSYPSSAVGTTATVATLENGRYADILAALRSGSPFTYGNKGAVATQLQTWGTFNFANWYLQQGIAGQPGTTPAPVGEAQSFALGVSGWHALNHSLATTLPTALMRTRALRRDILRRLA